MPIFAEDIISRMFLPELATLRDAIFARVLPAFDHIEAEAAQIERQTFHRFKTTANEYYDGEDLAEAAFEEGFAHYDLMTDTRQLVLNVLVIALFHLFEQQKHLLSFPTLGELEPDSRERDKLFGEFLETPGIDSTAFPDHTQLEELKLVANVAKHAEGQAAKYLRILRPELLAHGEGLPLPSHVKAVNRPLMGEDLFVQPDDLRAYFNAVESFWRFVLDQLPSTLSEAAPSRY